MGLTSTYYIYPSRYIFHHWTYPRRRMNIIGRYQTKLTFQKTYSKFEYNITKTNRWNELKSKVTFLYRKYLLEFCRFISKDIHIMVSVGMLIPTDLTTI